MSSGKARLRAIAAVSGLVMVGCSPAVPSSSPPTASIATPEPQVAGFLNPVLELDFPDPMIVRSGDRYLAVATNGNGSHVQVATSPDLVRWEQADDALPKLPEWTSPGKVWAPEISVVSETRSLLYYTTSAPDGRRQCLSVAVAERAEGPYTDDSRGPLVCNSIEQGGSIDPHPFQDVDGQRYLYWKNDGNAVGADTWLWVQRLSEDGARLVGKPSRLIKQDLAWEGSLIEAPFVVRSGETYHLFYSANDYASSSYAEGHAAGSSPTGPFRKDAEPVLASNDVAAGPGGGAIVMDGARAWMAYHAWAPDAIGSGPPGRQLWLSEVIFSGQRAAVEPPQTRNDNPPGR